MRVSLPFPGSIAGALLLGLALATPATARMTSVEARGEAVRLFLTPTGAPRLNGVVLAAEGDAVVVRQAYGMARFATGERLSPDAVFQTASAAKPFTATAVLQLRDAGLLELDDPVARHLAGFPRADVTIRHLLNHTSGLPDLELFEAAVAGNPDLVVSGVDLIPALQAWDGPRAFAPGDAFRYANTNYQLLARIVETVSRQRFADYMRENIFRPAGMRSTYVLGDPASDALPAPVANHVQAVLFREAPEDVATLRLSDPRAMRPYRYEGHNLGSTVGDQNLFTTVDDLRRFDRALRDGAVLSLESQAEAYTPTRLNDGSEYLDAEIYRIYQTQCSYGLGWEVCDHPVFGRIVGHAGYNRGIATLFYRNPAREQVIALFDNGGSGDFASVAASIGLLLNGEPALPLSSQKSLTRAYGVSLVEHGPVAALIAFNARRADTETWGFTPAGLNRLGYDLLRNGHPELAEHVFRLNVTLNPDQGNWYDSWADGLVALGRTGEAVALYERALELQPALRDTAAKLQALRQAGEQGPQGAEGARRR